MKKITVFTVVAAVAAAALADVELAGPFSDGAVLQRGRAVPVWGWAAPGEKVTVSFAGQNASATAGADGKWRVALKPMEASAEGRVLKAVGDKSAAPAAANDVLVGEVWFCAGQSNTECPLVGGNPRFRDGKGAMRAQMTNKPQVRFCHQSDYKVSVEPREKCKAVWKAFTPKNLAEGSSFSAMGVYFALELHSALGIPVGIVGTYWGGTRIEPWTPASGLASVPATGEMAVEKVYGSKEFGELGTNVVKRWKAPQQQPRVLWNEMVAPWTPYAIRGFIWYQGCSNAAEGLGYADKMQALYNGWAKEFENPDLRLRFVQLAPFGNGYFNIQLGQAKFAAAEKNAKMAVINDIGNLVDIHPNNKETVGQRLALLAMKYDYGFDVSADSPEVKGWRVEGEKFIVDVANAKKLYIYNPDRSVSPGFEICGADGQWKPGKVCNLTGTKRHGAKNRGRIDFDGGIDGTFIAVSAEGVEKPVKLRYLYSRPWFGCIYNEVNLPMGPFVVGE